MIENQLLNMGALLNANNTYQLSSSLCSSTDPASEIGHFSSTSRMSDQSERSEMRLGSSEKRPGPVHYRTK